jgi:hypothetical protein
MLASSQSVNSTEKSEGKEKVLEGMSAFAFP